MGWCAHACTCVPSGAPYILQNMFYIEPYIYTEHVLYRANSIYIRMPRHYNTPGEGESGVEDKARRDGHTSTMYTEHVLYRTCSICLLQMPRHYNTKERAAPRTRPSKRAIYLHRTRSIQNMFYMFTTRRRERRRGQGRAR